MLIVHVTVPIDEENVEAAITAQSELLPDIQATPGCESYHVLRRLPPETGIVLTQRWTDAAAFQAYKQGEIFARMGAALRPLMASAPATEVFEARTIDP